MAIDISRSIKEGLCQVSSFDELSRLCQKAVNQLETAAENGWVFTRYMKEIEESITTAAYRSRRAACNDGAAEAAVSVAPQSSDTRRVIMLRNRRYIGERVALGIALFDPDDSSCVCAGGATKHPYDRWDAHLGRAIAALRLVKIPFPLAALWCIEHTPWEHKPRIARKALFGLKLAYPWDCLDKAAIPRPAMPAVVQVVRHAVRFRLAEARPVSYEVNNTSTPIGSPHDLVNRELADQLADKACELLEPPTEEEIEKFKAEDRASKAARAAVEEGEASEASA